MATITTTTEANFGNFTNKFMVLFPSSLIYIIKKITDIYLCCYGTGCGCYGGHGNVKKLEAVIYVLCLHPAHQEEMLIAEETKRIRGILRSLVSFIDK